MARLQQRVHTSNGGDSLMKEQKLQLEATELNGFLDEISEIIQVKQDDSPKNPDLNTLKNGDDVRWVLEQARLYLKQNECSHEDLEFDEKQVVGEAIYEDFICQECGVKVTSHYERPTKRTVEYSNGDTEVIEE